MKKSNMEQNRMAQQRWELENSVEKIEDDIYRYNKQEQQEILHAKPWDKEYK